MYYHGKYSEVHHYGYRNDSVLNPSFGEGITPRPYMEPGDTFVKTTRGNIPIKNYKHKKELYETINK